MKDSLVHFAMTALLPAALNISAPAAGASLLVPVCTGDGLVRMVQVPVDGQQAPGNSNGMCCAKGCHAGSSRKRSLKNFAPAQ